MTAAAAMSMRYLHLAAFKLFHSTLFCDIISGCINHQLDVYPMAMEFFFFNTAWKIFFFFFPASYPLLMTQVVCARLVPIRSFLPLWIEYCLEEEIPFQPC